MQSQVVDFQYKIESFDDIVKLCKSKDTCDDIESLKKIKSQIYKLNRLVGMKTLKDQLTNQILYFIQDLQSDDMLHTALMGPPGVGKTTVAKILADIYKSLGILSKGKLIIATREDLVGQYLGETAIKTRSLLEFAKGSVLFIDEAYSLGNSNNDSYTKECVDTLVGFLSEHTKDFICIIAGYEKELKQHFFNSNPGLDRRFPWKYIIESYKPNDLTTIFVANIKGKWKLTKPKELSQKVLLLITQNKTLFSNNGGDILSFISACKMAHSKRVFGMDKADKRLLTEQDIIQGFNIYKLNKQGKTDGFQNVAHMYL